MWYSSLQECRLYRRGREWCIARALRDACLNGSGWGGGASNLKPSSTLTMNEQLVKKESIMLMIGREIINC